MLTDSYIKYLLCDVDNLYTYYYCNKSVCLDDVKRSLMLLERMNNVSIPDHYYRLGLEHSFTGINTLADVFVEGLVRLANKYLEYHGDKLYVKAELQNEWQLFIPYMPPLLVIAAKIWDTNSPIDMNPWEYIDRSVSKIVRHTALLPAYVPELNNFKSCLGGLSDLHIHLNGTIESDVVWQDMLNHPSEFCSKLAEAQENRKVKELYAQITKYYEPKDFRALIHAAISLKNKIFALVLEIIEDIPADRNYKEDIERSKLESFLFGVGDGECHEENSLLSIWLGESISDIQKECFFYIIVLDYLAKNRNDEIVAGLFHYYLLILGLNNMMLVQQPAMFGFEEFQKYTLNGFRWLSEITYNRRFFQLAGNSLDNIRAIEGRFAPKNTLDDNLSLIEAIEDGFEMFLNGRESAGMDTLPKLSLVAHFIKRPDSISDERFRFHELRTELRKKTAALSRLHRLNNKYSEMVVGIDAASSEFDTPPEVFAESYRTLRECGFEHFTFHAGEDFFHILSGLRAMYEAIEFLGLRCGDRIGHAVASGVSVGLWKDNLGDKLIIRKGEYLDNLVFAYHLISSYSKDNSLRDLLSEIALRIDEYTYDIYGDYYPVSTHIKAWRMRCEKPEEILDKNPDRQSSYEKLFLRYHSKNTRNEYDKIIVIDTYDVFGEMELTKLQWIMLELMHDKDLVIETLPTSNVVIGHHHDFSTYHLYNWWKWGKEGHAIPPIVVGTDDAGIFATNIYNEYCNIFSLLKYQKHMNTDDIMALIRQIDDNSRIYAFAK